MEVFSYIPLPLYWLLESAACRKKLSRKMDEINTALALGGKRNGTINAEGQGTKPPSLICPLNV